MDHRSGSHRGMKHRAIGVVVCGLALVCGTTMAEEATDVRVAGDARAGEEGDGAVLAEAVEAPPDAPGRVEELSARVERLAAELESERAARRDLEARVAATELTLISEQEHDADGDQRVTYSAAEGLHWRVAPERFELSLRGIVWARYNGGYIHDASEDGWDSEDWLNELSVPTVRLQVAADLGGGLVRAVAEPSITNGEVGIQDGYLELRLHPAANLRVGQMRVPYDREINTELHLLPVANYSPIASFFGQRASYTPLEVNLALGWDVGIMFHGTAGDRFHYRVGMFNGSDTGHNDNASMLWAILLRVRIVGAGSWWGWTDLERSRSPSLNMGVAFTHNDVYDGREIRLTGDIHLRWRGLSLAYIVHYRGVESEYIDEWLHAHGHQVHLGFVPWREHLELVFRFTWLDPDTDVGEGDSKDEGYEILAGFTLFLLGQNAKLTAQYSYISNIEGVFHDREAHLVQVQAQGWF